MFTGWNIFKYSKKIKKDSDNLNIELVPNKDILRSMGDQKKHQKLIGFALETNNEEENAKAKLLKKNLDFIVLNSMNDEGAGFKKDTNKISIIFPEAIKKFGVKPKDEVAVDILNEIVHLLDA